jgi:hypothetical protein
MNDSDGSLVDEKVIDAEIKSDSGRDTRGKPSPFTVEQKGFIAKHYLKDYLKLVDDGEPKDRLLKWKKAAVNEIVEHKLFKGQLNASKTDDQWRAVSIFYTEFT